MRSTDRLFSENPLFPRGYRASGLLLHITSLPSPFGIGDFGPEAFRWIDQLARAGQSWWQILPVGPTALGNSPYTPLSTFACNPLLISPQRLIEDGLLTPTECQPPRFSEDEVQYDAVTAFKTRLLENAWARFRSGAASHLSDPLRQFSDDQARWLNDYALFVALKQRFDGVAYVDWPAEYVHRDPDTLLRAAAELADTLEFVRFKQFLAFRQLGQVKQYAASKGVRLLGDLPIFVAGDSSDVWSHPELFQLDADRRPRFVAGVPPDYFSATGQLWGNPVYDWAAHRQTGYAWWTDRLRTLLTTHDVIRLDHFRGFSAAWHVPADAPTAETGQWVPGPGLDFFRHVGRAIGGLPFVAEDLGTITDDVRQLLRDTQLPRMGVLQFAFDGDPDNAFLPHHLAENMIAYTGTHDNDTTRGWYDSLDDDQRKCVWKYVKRTSGSSDEVAWMMIRLAWSSRSALAIAPLQDVLNLGSEARMNSPGVAHGNWQWRCRESLITESTFGPLRELTARSQRLPKSAPA